MQRGVTGPLCLHQPGSSRERGKGRRPYSTATRGKACGPRSGDFPNDPPAVRASRHTQSARWPIGRCGPRQACFLKATPDGTGQRVREGSYFQPPPLSEGGQEGQHLLLFDGICVRSSKLCLPRGRLSVLSSTDQDFKSSACRPRRVYTGQGECQRTSFLCRRGQHRRNQWGCLPTCHERRLSFDLREYANLNGTGKGVSNAPHRRPSCGQLARQWQILLLHEARASRAGR